MASVRSQCETRLKGMQIIRTDYEPEWREIARFAQPARSRFLSRETNKGGKRRFRNATLRDEHGIIAFRTLANGMTSGLSSSSRPWFTLGVHDQDLLESDGVRPWLSEVERRMYDFLGATNFYGAAKINYLELGLFGTAATVMVEHSVKGAVCHPLTAGEYWISMSDAMEPDTLYRRVPMTARQAVEAFKDRVNPIVRGFYDRSDYEQIVDCFQAIEPNPDHKPGSPLSKRWRSVWWDVKDDRDKTLRESGYHEQPFWAPRWDTTGADVYGYSPGMETLPTLRELQLQVKRRNEAIDHLVKPEKIVPPNLKLTGQPGNVVSASAVDKDGVLVPYQMPYQAITAISGEVQRCETKIDASSFADLFMAITNMQGVQPRNVEEIASRNEEKMTQLGPTIERVNTEMLSVVIDRTFAVMQRGGLLPPAPPDLRDAELAVEFVSILAQMQRMVGLGQIERTVSFIGNLAAADPSAMDKLNVDETIDEYGQRAGAPGKIIRTDAEVEKIRAARQQQQQSERLASMMPAAKDGADAAKLLSEADTGNGNVLQRLMPA